MADFTATQGRYLSFIQAYTNQHGFPPAESEIAAALCVSPPSVNQMVKMLEKRGLILRHPGEPRSLEILVPEEEIPPWNRRQQSATATRPKKKSVRTPTPVAGPPSTLYVFSIYLSSGPISEKFPSKIINRVIEIRGDQTLEQLHQAILKAFDRMDDHDYEFQLGKRPFDPDGPNYGAAASTLSKEGNRDARTTKLDDLNLKQHRAFGYWFDFGDDWYHQVQLERIEQAIPTVTYPRVIKRVGKSPPQYPDESRA
jgi:Plasmid pRiA4b ORF-3-like protein/LexA DNA binding domain